MGVLRLILALSVVIGHSTSHTLYGYFPVPGYVAVLCFFMISGFYMSLIRSTRYLGTNANFLFYTNRFFRLYPTYIVVLLLTIAAVVFVDHYTSGKNPFAWRTDWSQLDWLTKAALFVPNVLLVGADIVPQFIYHIDHGWRFDMVSTSEEMKPFVRLGRYLVVFPIWSIGSELWFYMLVPLLAKLRWYWLTIIVALSISLRVGMEYFSPWSSYYFFPSLLGFFVAGMLAHRLSQLERMREWLTSRNCMLVTGLLIGSLLIRKYVPVYRSQDYATYIALFFSLPFVFECTRRWQWDRRLGNVSYPLYLAHGAVQLTFVATLGFSDGLVATFACLLVAVLVARFVDEPVDAWRQKRLLATQACSP